MRWQDRQHTVAPATVLDNHTRHAHLPRNLWPGEMHWCVTETIACANDSSLACPLRVRARRRAWQVASRIESGIYRSSPPPLTSAMPFGERQADFDKADVP
jgi:hypothetical protein